MAHSIIMPKTGMAMEEGTVVRWLKKVGETISKGEAIAVIETDKVTMDLESDYEGTLLSIVRGDGEVVTATHTIAWVGVKGETVPAAAEAATGSPLPAAAASSPVSPTGHVADGPAPSGSAAPAADGRVPATRPLAHTLPQRILPCLPSRGQVPAERFASRTSLRRGL